MSNGSLYHGHSMLMTDVGNDLFNSEKRTAIGMVLGIGLASCTILCRSGTVAVLQRRIAMVY